MTRSRILSPYFLCYTYCHIYKLVLGMRPERCPRCDSDDIGELGDAEGEIFHWAGCQYSDEEYEEAGGHWYCVSCGEVIL